MIIYFLSAPTAYDCTFEQGFCQWTQSMTDNFNWTRAQGPTGSSLTGPTNDHTTGKGMCHLNFAADDTFKNLILTPESATKNLQQTTFSKFEGKVHLLQRFNSNYKKRHQKNLQQYIFKFFKDLILAPFNSTKNLQQTRFSNFNG